MKAPNQSLQKMCSDFFLQMKIAYKNSNQSGLHVTTHIDTSTTIFFLKKWRQSKKHNEEEEERNLKWDNIISVSLACDE